MPTSPVSSASAELIEPAPRPLLRTKTFVLGCITSLAGLVGACHEPTGAFIRAHAEIILGLVGIVSIILRRVTHGRVVLIPDIGDDTAFRILPVLLSAAMLCGCGGNAGGARITLDPLAGVCAVSEDGRYRVCYNPLTKGYTITTAVPGGVITALTYDSASRQWRGTLPDGSTAVYGSQGIVIEPPLPAR